MTAPYRTRAFDAPVTPFHVLIIGGGIGGLTLAQGLKKAGISVAVYERDETPSSRLQGYRVHVNPAGSLALHECLPPHLFEAFEQTCGRPGRAIHFLTEQMDTLLRLDGAMAPDIVDGSGIARHRSVSRITLRQVLLSGLDGVVRFGKTFARYEEPAGGRIVAHFEDGTAVEGDMLIAADGGGSRVRKQYLPQAARIDTGVVGIAGKVFLNEETRRRIAPQLLDGISLVSARGGYGLFVATQDYAHAARQDGIGRGGAHAGHLDNTQSYLMWALSGRRDKLGVIGDEPRDSKALGAIALQAMDRWSDRLSDLVWLSDRTTLSLLPIRTSLPVAPWETSRITLLGDAIHAMTPFRGIGANIALKDAVRLRDAIVAGESGERPLIDAIQAYESEMLRYGFAAVKNSLAAMEQTVGENELGRTLARAAFRVVDRLPPVKRWMFRRMGDE
jgi:2-polyprenyl-6-methoxyphenol hydroxylase-like FAD-dependent oxidoreductase